MLTSWEWEIPGHDAAILKSIVYYLPKSRYRQDAKRVRGAVNSRRGRPINFNATYAPIPGSRYFFKDTVGNLGLTT